MAKKKKIIDVRSKLHHKKPLKNCAPALDDYRRVKKNEQAKLYRLNKKFSATNKKGAADKLRKEIRTQERAITGLSRNVSTINKTCQIINKNKHEISGLRAKRAAIERKLKKMYESRDFKGQEKLNADSLKLGNQIADLKRKNTDALYQVNKKLGFDPKEIAEQLKINRRALKKAHGSDLTEEEWEEWEREAGEHEKETGGGAAEGPDARGLEVTLDELFWEVSKDFDTVELPFNLKNYESVIIVFNGRTYHYHGENMSISLIDERFRSMIRWAQVHEDYIYIRKEQDAAFTKLKYTAYQVPR